MRAWSQFRSNTGLQRNLLLEGGVPTNPSPKFYLSFHKHPISSAIPCPRPTVSKHNKLNIQGRTMPAISLFCGRVMMLKRMNGVAMAAALIVPLSAIAEEMTAVSEVESLIKQIKKDYDLRHLSFTGIRTKNQSDR